jgi:hypothetical protein
LKEALLKTKSLSEQREPNGVKKEDFDHQTVEVGLICDRPIIDQGKICPPQLPVSILRIEIKKILPVCLRIVFPSSLIHRKILPTADYRLATV